MPAKRKRPEYRPVCECGDCPRLPTSRPPTLQECIAYWGHDGWYSPAKVEELAVPHYVFAYAQWVNEKGWRKPPGWTGGNVPPSRFRPKSKPLTRDDVSRATTRLLAQRRKRRG